MEGKDTGSDTRLMADENDPQQEPSMEDILASIRRILSEDEQEETSAESSVDPGVDLTTDPAPTPEPLPGSETELVSEPGMATASEEMAAEGMEEELVSPAPEPKTVIEQPETVPQEPESALVSETQIEPVPASESAAETPASSSSSPTTEPMLEDILELTEQMIAQPPPDVGAGAPILSGTAQGSATDTLQELAKALLSRRDIAIGSRELTLEGLIREILRPLLREWLDENLPYLIERLVKKEIDHMVNRAERLDL